MSENKKSSLEMVKLGLVLALYASVSCAVLALVNNFTAPKIAANQEAKIASSMKAFFPEEGCHFEKAENFSGKNLGNIKIEQIILAKKEGLVLGGAAQVSGPTYDQGTIFVGMKKDGTLQGLKFLKLTDSPGFGLKANDPTFTLPNGKTFYGQFEGKNAASAFKAGENFDAISGATITSLSVAALINAGTSSIFEALEASSSDSDSLSEAENALDSDKVSARVGGEEN